MLCYIQRSGVLWKEGLFPHAHVVEWMQVIRLISESSEVWKSTSRLFISFSSAQVRDSISIV